MGVRHAAKHFRFITSLRDPAAEKYFASPHTERHCLQLHSPQSYFYHTLLEEGEENAYLDSL